MHAGSYRKILAESISVMGTWLSKNCYRFVFFISTAGISYLRSVEELIARQNSLVEFPLNHSISISSFPWNWNLEVRLCAQGHTSIRVGLNERRP
jgi:hypothetical protein